MRPHVPDGIRQVARAAFRVEGALQEWLIAGARSATIKLSP